MATRFYFNTTTQTAQSQAINSGWTGSHSSFARYYFETTATSAFQTLTNTKSMTLGDSFCFGQWWTHPINNASSFSSTDWNNSTWTFLMRHSESATAANRAYKAQLRIWDGSSFVNDSFFTGATEFDVGNGATTNSLMESRRLNAGDYWGAIGPFSNGIRLVLEVGDYKLSGTLASHTSYSEIGGNSGTDLDNSEIDKGKDNPWFECSLNFTFDAEPSTSTPSRMMLMGAGQ